MKTVRAAIIVLSSVSFSISAGAYGATAAPSATPSLEDQLQMLNLPANQAPGAVSTEKLYSVQSRFNPLKGKFEITLGAGQDFTNSSSLVSQQIGGALRYHLNDRFSLGLSGAQVYNSLTETARQLLNQEGILADVAYAKYRANAELAVNTFYGKFRISKDSVLYLDQYIALGAGVVGLDRGNATMATLDLGFAFWIGQSGVVRLGMKDHIYKETRLLSSAMTQHWVGHVQVGWMPGGSPVVVR